MNIGVAKEIAGKGKEIRAILLPREIKRLTEQKCIKEALKKLEYLLNVLKNNNHEISDDDFDKVILFIYEVFKNIVEHLD